MTAEKWLDFVRPGEHPSSIITAASAATAIPNMPIRTNNAHVPPPTQLKFLRCSPPSPFTCQAQTCPPTSSASLVSNTTNTCAPLPRESSPSIIKVAVQQTPPNHSQVLQSKQIIAACFEMQKQMDAEVFTCRITNIRLIWFVVVKIV